MGTPGKAKALRALGKAKRKNRARIAKGEAPVIEGEKVSAATFAKKTGTTVAKVKEGGPPQESEAKSKAAIVKKWGKKAVGPSHGAVGAEGYGTLHGCSTPHGIGIQHIYDEEEDDVDLRRPEHEFSGSSSGRY